jgi:hypothetical protein
METVTTATPHASGLGHAWLAAGSSGASAAKATRPAGIPTVSSGPCQRTHAVTASRFGVGKSKPLVSATVVSVDGVQHFGHDPRHVSVAPAPPIGLPVDQEVDELAQVFVRHPTPSLATSWTSRFHQ